MKAKVLIEGCKTVKEVIDALSKFDKDLPVLLIDHDYQDYIECIDICLQTLKGKDYIVMGAIYDERGPEYEDSM